jgi:transposase
MKFVSPLTETDKVFLKKAHTHAATPRERQRAHSIILSSEKYSIKELSEIFQVQRNTISVWIDKWEKLGTKGLVDQARSGRPTIYTAEENEQLKIFIDEDPRNIRAAQSKLELKTGKSASRKTLQRILKKI